VIILKYMANYNYQIINNSGELGLDLNNQKILIGDRVLASLNSQNFAKVTGAKKRFTHEWWHVLFAALTKKDQNDLLTDFKENVLKDPETQKVVQLFCERLYREGAYDFHRANPGDRDMFVDSGFGIKVKDTIKIGEDDIYGAFLLTEILSLSSESETPNIEEYYDSVEPKDSKEHELWSNKKELGLLSRQIVSSMQSPLLEKEFKGRTQEGIELLQEINQEFLEMKESQSEFDIPYI
jgi:hypothetical protein